MAIHLAPTATRTRTDTGDDVAVAAAEEQVRTRIRDAAIDEIGQHGLRTSVKAIAAAAGISPEALLDLYDSKRGLLRACDEYIVESIEASKTEALQSPSPDSWLTALSEIDTFAPMMAYLFRSIEEGGNRGHTLLDRMIDNAVDYLEAGVRAGTLKPSRDPRGRANFLALNNAGGFLLYCRRHATPTDMAAVLRDYARDMIMPALELYTQGLLVDAGDAGVRDKTG